MSITNITRAVDYGGYHDVTYQVLPCLFDIFYHVLGGLGGIMCNQKTQDKLVSVLCEIHSELLYRADGRPHYSWIPPLLTKIDHVLNNEELYVQQK